MDKKYQVFISSTYTDLIEERKEVIQALLELDCIPCSMEMFQASDDSQWKLIQREISKCDYYIVIIAGRYGTVHPKTHKSYTQMEYEYALSAGIPVLGFIHKCPETIIAQKVEKDAASIEKLTEFKKIVSEKMVRYWSSPQELGAIVSRGMVNIIKTHPRSGWVKAGPSIRADQSDEADYDAGETVEAGPGPILPKGVDRPAFGPLDKKGVLCRDFLYELNAIGAGSAASCLSCMIDKKVVNSPPNSRMVSLEKQSNAALLDSSERSLLSFSLGSGFIRGIVIVDCDFYSFVKQTGDVFFHLSYFVNEEMVRKWKNISSDWPYYRTKRYCFNSIFVSGFQEIGIMVCLNYITAMQDFLFDLLNMDCPVNRYDYREMDLYFPRLEHCGDCPYGVYYPEAYKYWKLIDQAVLVESIFKVCDANHTQGKVRLLLDLQSAENLIKLVFSAYKKGDYLGEVTGLF